MLTFTSAGKVILQPVQKTPVVQYERVTDRDLEGNETAELDRTLTRAPGTKFSIQAFPSKKLNGFLATGLQYTVANPYKDREVFKSKEWEDILKGKEEVKLQHLIEYKFDKPLGYYTNEIPLRRVQPILSQLEVDKNPTFFSSEAAIWDLEDAPQVLDLSSERDLVLYYLLLDSEICASSYAEINHMTHNYYISSEHEEEQMKAARMKESDLAVSRLVEISASANNAELLTSFGNVCNLRTKGVSPERIYEDLSSKLKGKDKSFIKNFNYYYNLFKNPETKDMFLASSKVVDYLNFGVIIQRGTQYIWTPPTRKDGQIEADVNWARRDELIDFIASPASQPERVLMDEQLERKKQYR